jgi:hypothetical protein
VLLCSFLFCSGTWPSRTFGTIQSRCSGTSVQAGKTWFHKATRGLFAQQMPTFIYHISDDPTGRIASSVRSDTGHSLGLAPLAKVPILSKMASAHNGRLAVALETGPGPRARWRGNRSGKGFWNRSQQGIAASANLSPSTFQIVTFRPPKQENNETKNHGFLRSRWFFVLALFGSMMLVVVLDAVMPRMVLILSNGRRQRTDLLTDYENGKRGPINVCVRVSEGER